ATEGVYRVFGGDFPESAAADPLKKKLQQAGYGRDLFVARRPATEPFDRVLRIRDDEGETHSFEGESVLVLPAKEGSAIAIGDDRYRGGARLLINDRGLLNVVNEVWLEDYLKGVVPNEMGPSVYPELEAIKAQTLAARTYGVSRMGEYAREGYDICATAACQVYKGVSTEHALSNQAIQETEGTIIVWQGEPIDALFTSTCGGETSDVATMFPGRSEPYLKHVRCVELERVELAGRADSGMMTPWELDGRIFEAAAGLSGGAWNREGVARAVSASARLAGIAVPAGAVPAGTSRREILEFLGAALRFTAWEDILLLPEDRSYFFPRSAEDEAAYRAAAFMNKFRILPGQNIDGVDLSEPMPRLELYAILQSWLERQNAIREVFGTLEGIDGRRLSLLVDGTVRVFELPAGIPLLRILNDRAREYRSLPLMIGDRATVFIDLADRPLALVAQANYDGAAFDRTSSYSSWVRSYSAKELVESIARRNPIQSLNDLKPLQRDAAERIVSLEVVAENGRTFVLEGLPIRWSLMVPDNLFTVTRSTDPAGGIRFTFWGKGWGHGTGMCQVGAYGMAFRGATAEEIIRHYYTGVSIGRLEGNSGLSQISRGKWKGKFGSVTNFREALAPPVLFDAVPARGRQ
ncbi:MAG TPA: SpoIID/LytB domain-containing protein, partial [Thermoanaerobaculia bacterium]|nr:SpoIID/LytB domain-containing protein [Thermoanaerobaculia bacterium]